jgi:hypothetical protein
MDQAQRVPKRKLWHLAGGVLGSPKRAVFEGALEASVRTALRGHEHMFPQTVVRFSDSRRAIRIHDR